VTFVFNPKQFPRRLAMNRLLSSSIARIPSHAPFSSEAPTRYPISLLLNSSAPVQRTHFPFSSQDVLNEIERNLIDAMAVARNVVRLVPLSHFNHFDALFMFSTPNSCPAAARPK
jgi:hypothetical protein